MIFTFQLSIYFYSLYRRSSLACSFFLLGFLSFFFDFPCVNSNQLATLAMRSERVSLTVFSRRFSHASSALNLYTHKTRFNGDWQYFLFLISLPDTLVINHRN